MALIDRQAQAAYEQCMASYAQMTPLPPDLEAQVHELPWQSLDEATREHWRAIVRAVLRA